jgi:2-C-methyl-D-erythritol 4-phosphate cytidylyltransferase
MKPMNRKRWGAVILAAGIGERYGGPKQLELINGSTVLEWAIRRTIPHVDEIVLVVNAEVRMGMNPWCSGVRSVVLGGTSRHESMAVGLKALGAVDCVMVVDAVRCNTPAEIYIELKKIIEFGYFGTCPLMDPSETVIARGRGKKYYPLARGEAQVCQTPEAYEIKSLLKLIEKPVHRKSKKHISPYWDNLFIGAMIVSGVNTKHFRYIDGDPRNIKLTYRHDLVVMKNLWVSFLNESVPVNCRVCVREDDIEGWGVIDEPPPFAK